MALLAAVYTPSLFVLWEIVVVNHFAVSPDPNVPLWTVWPGFLPPAMFLVAFGRLCRDLWNPRMPVNWRPAIRRYA